MTEEERQQLADLIAWKTAIEQSSTIPINIDQSFRTRFSDIALQTSTKSASSENHAVNESGSASYSVLGPPDAFVQKNVGGTTFYLPAFT